MKALSLHIEKLIENYHKLIYYAIKGGVILLNYAIKHYFFDHNATRDFFSGKNYNLFLIISGSGNFKYGDTTLSIQPQNLIIFKPNVSGRLEFINSHVPMDFFLIQLSSELLQESQGFPQSRARSAAARPDQVRQRNREAPQESW